MKILAATLSLVVLSLVTLVYSDDKVPVDELIEGNHTIGIKSGNVACVLMSFRRINVAIKHIGENHTVHSNHTYHHLNETKILKEQSHCGNITQRLTLDVFGNQLRFHFRKVEKSYNLTSISFYLSNEELRKNLSVAGVNESDMAPDLKAKVPNFDIGKAYNCKHQLEFKFNLTKSEEILVNITGFKFSAFRHSNTTEISAKLVECEDPNKSKPGNDIIPIAVGGVLTGFLVLSLVAYLVIRNRRN